MGRHVVTGRRRRARAGGAAVALAALAAVAGACLAPGEHDPTGTAPFGNLESVRADGDGIRVVGWVADPDTTAPIAVTLSSNQRTITAVAGLHRPDVGAAHPRVGPNHGFDVRYPGLGPGVHQICVWADNVGAGNRARALGCADVDLGRPPVGNLESVTGGPGVLGGVAVVSGWTLDPDFGAPIDVVATVDGQVVLRSAANLDRPDVRALYGRTTPHGFRLEVPAAPGRRTVCVRAVNVGPGSDQPLGCAAVDVATPPADRRPTGAVLRARPEGAGAARLTGTAADVDGAVTQARLRVDGGPPRTVAVAAGLWEDVVTGLGAGPHSICATLVDVPSAPGFPGATGDRELPCSTVVVGGTSVGSAGAPTWIADVGPPPGHPLARIDRDGGVSVQLRDGSSMWFFADSSEVDAEGHLRYFVNNTAAWSAPGSTQTRDAVAAGPRPVQFVDPGQDFPACPAGRTPAMWPLSAVVQPVGGRDRVVVFLGNVCLGGFLDITEAGIAVAEYWYDPAAPPVDSPVRGTLLRQVLFVAGADDHGTAAVIDDAGRINAYACRRPPTPTFMVPGAYGPCTVGRVDPAHVEDPASWRWWNGSSWTSDKAAAAPMALPDAVNGFSLPVASASVARDPVHGRYVMAYSPWPGFTDRIEVRVATQPQGPWTAPVDVWLPGCSDSVGGQGFYCYAGTTQPAWSGPGLLGLGYYDQRLDVAVPRGQYRVAQVPFDVVGAG